MRNTFDREHVLSLCEKGDYGIFPPPLDSQTALNELQRYFLGDDWYIPDPISTSQANAVVVAEIEKRYKGAKIRRKL